MLRLRPWLLSAALLGCAHPQRQAPHAENLQAARPSAPERVPAAREPEREPCALPTLGEASSEELVAQLGTRLEPYQREGGAWLPNAPVLVNQNFDFAMALAMGPVGAGLAAGKRKEANQRKVSALAEMVLSADTLAQLDALRAQGVHAYLVLWGAEDAVLRLVMERARQCGREPEIQVYEGAQRGHGTWAMPGELDREARSLLEQGAR
jgi:hypothetical protein